jgi:hypothetical protein
MRALLVLPPRAGGRGGADECALLCALIEVNVTRATQRLQALRFSLYNLMTKHLVEGC